MGDEKDNSRTNSLADNTLNRPRLNVFKNDALMNFVHKKTERITTALYMITSLFSSEEPLKWKLREKGIDLMLQILQFGTGLAPDSQMDAVIVPLIIGQVSLLEVAYVSGAISEMNFVVLKKEYESVIELFEKSKMRRRETGKEGYMIPKNFFDLPNESSLVEFLEWEDTNLATKKTSQVLHATATKEESLKGHMIGWDGNNGLHANMRQNMTTQNPRSKNRREAIIGILREQGKRTIKDITKVVRGCSEKTVQRELLSLVRDGIVMKEGERRWSTYSLVV